MDLIKSPNQWSCLPTAVAMVVGRSIEEILLEVGHDGSEIVWPELSEPYCRRSFHIQELINVIYFFGHLATPFQAVPCSIAKGAGSLYIVPFRQPPEKRLGYIMKDAKGIIIGETYDGQPHAVAWNGERVFDPNGTKYELEKFIIDTFWLIRY